MFFRTNALRHVGGMFVLFVVCMVVALATFQVSHNKVHAQSLGNVHASTPSITEYPLPNGNSDPWGTAMDKSGNVWVAVPGCDPSPMCSNSTPPGRLAEFNPTTSQWIGTYQLPSGYAQPLFLAFDKQGMLWFALPMGNAIGQFNPTSQKFNKWTVPTASSGPWDVAIDGNGKIWFTEHYTNKIGRFNPTNHTFKEFTTPASNSQPYGITVDASNNVWFTENNAAVALIAEYTAAGKLKEYKIRNSYDPNLTPHLIALDHSGNVWWTEGFVGMLGKLKISSAVPKTNTGMKEFAYPTSGGCGGVHTSGIGVDSTGLIWFDDSLQCIVGHFSPSTKVWQLSPTPTGGSHPHDGLAVDSSNHIWFDEEFAYKLGKAV